MNFKQIKLLSWNVRGLGSIQKCSVVRNVVREYRCHVICIQESKWSGYDFAYVSSVLPSCFDKECVMLNARGTAGVVLLRGEGTI